MLGFIMAKEINSFLSPPVLLAARVKSHQTLINEPSLAHKLKKWVSKKSDNILTN